jgi:hypothetical protein
MFTIEAYSREALTRLFLKFCDSGERGGTSETMLDNPLVREKHHIGYLHGFLDKIDCRAILVEDHYVDRDYLEDFAAYHVRAFYPYRRHCARLHFFGMQLKEDDITKLIRSDPDAIAREALQDAYLGFVVIKPLPFTVVGRTCLRTYPNDPPDERRYPVAYDERVNLFGIELTVRTLPFQEQDRDVAACASSALWSVFHATGKRFQHAIPSPVQITNIATQRSGYDERVLPNQNGLNSRQIADAIRAVELEPCTIGLCSRADASGKPARAGNRDILLKIAAAAYLRAGIPCVLLSCTHERLSGDKRRELGNHAMALTGYRMPEAEPVAYGDAQILFDASRINRLYAHDDQVGPFARMGFRADGGLATSQVNSHDKRDRIVAEPTHLMVPLYHKIRIPFQQVLRLAFQIDRMIETIRNVGGVSPPSDDRIVWDLELTTLEDYRARLRASDLAPEAKLAALVAQMPRFIWRLAAADKVGAPLFDLLFDPTDLLQGRLFLRAVGYRQASLDSLMFAMIANDPKLFKELPLQAMRAEFARLICKDES